MILIILISLIAPYTTNTTIKSNKEFLEKLNLKHSTYQLDLELNIGDFDEGGYHLATGNWWEPKAFNVSALDWDGDGWSNENDSWPLDHSRPPTSNQPFCENYRGVEINSSYSTLVCNDLNSQMNFPDIGEPLVSRSSSTRINTGDIDNDGDLDLVANDGFTINLFLNEDGEISSSPFWNNIDSLSGVQGIEFVDIENDGDLDLFIATNGHVSGGTHIELDVLYINHGNGSYNNTFDWNSSEENQGPALEFYDINNDGFIDLLRCDRHSGEIRVHMNNLGQLSRNPDQIISTISCYSMEVSDTNHNGNDEVLIGGSNGIVAYEINSGIISTSTDWTLNPSGWEQVTAIETGDLNQDGLIDLVLGFGAFSTISVTETKLYLNSGNGFSDSSIPNWIEDSGINEGASDLQLSDMDNDGDLDLLISRAGWGNGESRLIPNEKISSESFQNDELNITLNESNAISIGVGESRIISADIDNDYDQDIIVNDISINHNPGGGTWDDTHSEQYISSSNNDSNVVVSGDLDRDGSSEIIVGGTGESIMIYESGKSESLHPEWISVQNYDVLSLDLGDVNKDGYLDLAIGIENGHDKILYGLDSEIGFDEFGPQWTSDSIQDTWTVKLVDINNDDYLDLFTGAVGSPNNDKMFFGYSEENGGSWLNTISTTPNWTSLSSESWSNTFDANFGDVDGDGDLDLVRSANKAHITYNNNGVFTTTSNYQLSGSMWSYNNILLDVNNDEIDDIIYRDQKTTIRVATISSNGISFSTSSYDPFPNSVDDIVEIKKYDLNFDGLLDVFIADSTGNLAIYLNSQHYGFNFNEPFLIGDFNLEINDFEFATMHIGGMNNRQTGLFFAIENDYDVLFKSDSDLDGDLIIDINDEFDFDPTQSTDSDGDGYGDNSQGKNHDIFPNDSTQWIDFDNDGFGDNPSGINADLFPNDSTQWFDSDNDGFGDNPSGNNPDDCFSQPGVSWRDRLGCPDMDEDGQSDLNDLFMQQPTQWNDTDGDGLGDNWDGFTVNRNGSTTYAGIGEYIVNANLPDPFPLDYDNDGFEDLTLQLFGANAPFDDCPLIYGLSSRDLSGCVDSDNDGWSDVGDSHPGDGTQNSDQDGDGYGDNINGNLPDSCPLIFGTSVIDRYGCIDNDGDGVSNWTDFDDFDPNEQSDLDNDGYGDVADLCPFIWGNISFGNDLGCPDTDGDGWADRSDDLPLERTQHIDTDGDGFGDNLSGITPDACASTVGTSTMSVSPTGENQSKYGCPDTDGDTYEDLTDPCPFQFGNSWVDRFACPDSDQDGISDSNDPYPNDRAIDPDDWDGDGVNNDVDDFPGDSTQWIDADGDGYGANSEGNSSDWNDEDPTQQFDSDLDGFGDNLSGDSPDACPDEFGNSTIPGFLGCPDADGDGYPDTLDYFPNDSTQWQDFDGDGYGDYSDGNWADECPNTYGTSQFDRLGCLDSDEDGTSDLNDICPNLFGLDDEERAGCPLDDADQDGVPDLWDDLPFDPEHSVDSDGDGYGEYVHGSEPDACPNEPGNSWIGGFGCPDTDKDGWGDINDDFPTDGTQWSDQDDDGYGDSEIGLNPDNCPEINGNSSLGNILGCIDSDGDGWSDDIDSFPEDILRWSDEDNDGFSDQGDDDCPNLAGYSTEPWTGCPDMDNDGIMDIADEDTDGDGINNNYERMVSEILAEDGIIFDPYDPNSTPNDYDGDYIPDELDDDADGDGYPNDFENERGSDALNSNNTPLNMYGNQDVGFFYKPGEGFTKTFDSEAFEISISSLISLITSEYLIPIIMFPLVLFLTGRKNRRFKRFRKNLERSDRIIELKGMDERIDSLIEGNKVKIHHALLLRNLFERKRDLLENKNKSKTSISSKINNEKISQKFDDSKRSKSSVISNSNRGPPNRGPKNRGPPNNRY